MLLGILLGMTQDDSGRAFKHAWVLFQSIGCLVTARGNEYKGADAYGEWIPSLTTRLDHDEIDYLLTTHSGCCRTCSRSG
jgi:hypothetical protein